ncbi:hypothetical protein D9611_012445 [Ephemerocybe angulata]|uniref:ATP-dependent DNA helicase n=1 Tax=Ephemerocybe angulata TaxID=980116 RepID=A0A8H5CE07_9AGAR|nr:hypothetical protein D9611_012445 [Tulosesus angulatus]
MEAVQASAESTSQKAEGRICYDRRGLEAEANPESELHMQKVQYSDGRMVSTNFDIEESEWKSGYKLIDVALDIEDNDCRTQDPSVVYIKHPIHALIQTSGAIRKADMRIIGKFHGIRLPASSGVKDLTRSLVEHRQIEANAGSSFGPAGSPISAGLNPTPNTCRTTLGSPEAGESGAVATVQQDASSDPPSTTTTHLVPVGETPMLRIVKEWQRDMALESFIKQPCAACSSMTCAQDIRKIAGSTLDLTLLRNDLIPEQLLPKSYNFLAYDRAILDPEGLEKREVKANIYLCKHCASELSKRQMPKFALANWLYYAREHLPSDVKKAFEEMSIFEKALICRVRTNSLLCRFSIAGVEADPFNDKYIQTRRHIRGNVISTPLDVIKLNDVLPPSGTMLRDTICALIVSATLPTDATIESLTPILVRKSRVKLLIEFLVQNNPHYSKCEGFNGFSSEYLEDLFSGTSDTGIPAAANIGHLPINHAVESLTDDYTDRSNGVSGLFMENVAYTLGDHSAQSFLDMKFHAVEQCTSRKPFLHSRSGSRPVPDIENPAWLSWAHPNADPFGLGGFNDSRRRKAIGMEQQLKHILTANDPFFERDPELAFDVYNIVRKGAVNTSLRFSVPYGVYARTAEKIASLDKDLVTGLRQKYKRNPNYQPSSIPEINLIRVMSSIAPLARNIPGTVSQKIKMRNEIRAIISQRGSPTLFVTINPSDYHHPLVSVLATRAKSKEDILTLRGMDSTTRGNIAVQHPVACAQFFDAMMKAFIHIILKHGRKNAAPGIFGHCDAYYGTVETQGRGTLHCHLLIWLKDHLPAEKLADELRNSSEYGQALTTWIDSIMTSGFLGSRAVLNNLPFESDNDTVETKDPHPASKAEPLAREHRPTDFRREMKEFGMTETVVPATTIDRETGTLTVSRLHPRMTQYNPTITFLMKCNTDIKFIGSGADAKAFMYYVTDYITKAPLSMHAGLTALSYAIRQGEARLALPSQGSGTVDHKRAVTIAVNSMLGRQEISHPQVMSYILGGGECYTSESFQAINWAEVLRYVTEQTLTDPYVDPPTRDHDQDRHPANGERSLNSLRVSMRPAGDNITASNTLMDYIFRPKSEPYQSMGLYNHVASTRRTAHKAGSKKVHTGSFSSDAHPQHMSHILSSRRKPVVPVLLGPRIQRRHGNDFEQESWARDMCILFKPWRQPSDLNAENTPWQDKVDEIIPLLSERDKKVLDNMALIAEGKQARDERPRGKNRGISESALLELENLPDLEAVPERPLVNIYAAALEPIEGGTDYRIRSKASDYLDSLLGPGASRAIQSCFPATSLQSSNTLESVTITHSNPGQNDADIISAHRKYMAASKRRKAPSDEEESGESGPKKRRRRRRVKEIHPAAEIVDTISLPSTQRNAATRPQAMEAARILASSKGLISNPEQFRAFMTIADHATKGGQQLLMYVGGEGGTGKSYLIETVVEFFSLLGRKDEE